MQAVPGARKRGESGSIKLSASTHPTEPKPLNPDSAYLVAQPRLLLERRLHDADGGRHHAEAVGAAGRGRMGALEAEGMLGGGACWCRCVRGSRLH